MKFHHHHFTFPSFIFGFSLCLLSSLCFLMFQRNIIMTHDQINCLHNTNETWRVLFGSTLCQHMELLQPKTGNPLKIWFYFLSWFLIMWCLPVFQRIINMFWVRILPAQTLFQKYIKKLKIERNQKKIRGGNKRSCDRVIPTWTCLWFSWTGRH